MKSKIVINQFSSNARSMRGFFEDQFEDPLITHQKRFVWDYWNVPGQYRLMRTPAYHYFPSTIYNRFHKELVEWGRTNLGCHDISPPWLSYYVDGCKQNLHSDVPHGPWAFVYSLSPQKIKFTGGETLLFRNEVLNYWTNFRDTKDREESSFVEKIPSRFNSLIVFDPRIPHGVTEVKGVEDPREARLVIHGWFVEPRPYVVGGLSPRDVDSQLQQMLAEISNGEVDLGAIWGTLSVESQILPSGAVRGARILTDTCVGTDGCQHDVRLLKKAILNILLRMKFKKRTRGSRLVVPILFK